MSLSRREVLEQRLAEVKLRKIQALRPQVEEARARKRVVSRDDLIAWTQLNNPRYKAGKFHRHLAARLQAFSAAVTAGEGPRMIVNVPPQYGKSELCSRNFPAWHLSRNSYHRVILASYADDLASQMSVSARAAVETASEWVAQLSHGKSAKWTNELWTLDDGGGVRSAGVGGGITGMSAHVGIIDDPVKDEEQARSAAFKRRFESWYETAFMTRIQEGGGILVVSTRWGVDDPVGYLLERQRLSGGKPWEIIRYPAIAEADEYAEDGTLWRREGEPLSPERYSLETMLERKLSIAPWRWASVYQQQPVPADGSIFRSDHFGNRYDALPAMDEIVISCDLTFKDKATSDFVVMQVWGRKKADCYLIEQVRRRMDYPASKAALRDLVAAYRPQAVVVEDKANGSAMVAELRKEKDIVGIQGWDPGRLDKRERAEIYSLPRYTAGQVWLPSGKPWIHDFVAEHLGFLAGAAHDDQIDAESQFFAWLATRAAPAITAKSLTSAFGRFNA